MERTVVRPDARRHQRCLVPLLVLLLGIALQPRGSAATREVATYLSILVALGLVAGFLFEASPGAEFRKQQSLSLRLGHARWLFLVLAQVVCIRCDHAAHSILLKLLAFVVFPLSGARDADRLSYSVYLVVHFIGSCVHVGDDLAGEGWQWLSVLVVCDFLFWDFSEVSRQPDELQEMLKITTQVVHNILGTICDGCLLLKPDGTLAGADQKADDLLSLQPQDSGATARATIGCILDCALDNDKKLVRGLRMLRLPTGSKDMLQVEAYILPFSLTSADATLLGLQVQISDAAGALHLCAFRLASGELMEPDASRPQQPVAMPPRELAPRNGFIQSGRSEVEDSAVDSGLGSPRTQAASVLPGAVPAHPGIPLQAIQAVGLGVGQYTKVRVVGRGSQAQVWQVTSEDGSYYALKEIGLKGQLWHRDFPKRLRDADREVRALKGLAWASCVIVPIVDCWMQKDFEMSCIVMEWLPQTLDAVLKRLAEDQAKSGPVPLQVASSWLTRLAAGLAAIHAAGYIHRDLKPSNVLLDESLQQCKITDLGVSRSLHRVTVRNGGAEEHRSSNKSNVSANRGGGEEDRCSMVSENMGSILSGYTVRPGTVAYTSPEAQETSHYGAHTDIFSLGVVLLETLTLEVPPEPRLGEVMLASARMDRAKSRLAEQPTVGDRSGDSWTELCNLCVAMLQPSEMDRPSAKEIANSKMLLPLTEQLVQKCPRLRVLLLHTS